MNIDGPDYPRDGVVPVMLKKHMDIAIIVPCDRKAMRERLTQYVAGGRTSPSAPLCYSGRPWTQTSHKYTPPHLREAVKTLLMHANRLQPHLPRKARAACARVPIGCAYT